MGERKNELQDYSKCCDLNNNKEESFYNLTNKIISELLLLLGLDSDV